MKKQHIFFRLTYCQLFLVFLALFLIVATIVVSVSIGIANDVRRNDDPEGATTPTPRAPGPGPDPLSKAAPSNSEFGSYESAAVAVDADECAEIGT